MTAAASARRLSPAFALPAFLVATIAATALVSPVVLAALERAGATGVTLEAVTLRVLELAAIGLTFPLLAVLGGGGRAAWGIPPARAVPATLGVGVLIGVASLLPVCAVLFALDVRVVRADIDADAGWWLTVIARAALAAAVIAAMEELWFRGGLFTALERAAGRAGALWAGAAVYAGAHFLDAPDGLTLAGSGVTQTLAVLAHATSAVFRAENLDSFAALLVAGLALGLVRLRRGHVALAIGIHAGWVLAIKVFKKYTYIDPASPERYLAGRYDDFIGWVAAACLGALLAMMWWRLQPADRRA